MLEMNRNRKSDEFVRHVTSPSRRDKHDKSSLPNLFKFDRRRLKHQRTVQPLRHSLRPPQLKSRSHAPLPTAGSTMSFLFFLSDEARMLHLEKFRHRTSVPILLWVRTQRSLGKRRLTRTPPPICTSASILDPRWSQEPLAPRAI